MLHHRAGLIIVLSTGLAVGLPAVVTPAAEEEEVTIKLTIIPCQILEPEKIDHGYKVENPLDCKEITERTGSFRADQARTMVLAPGSYLFSFTNKNVPYPVGFWIRQEDFDWRYFLDRLLKFNHMEAAAAEGETKEFKADLKEGTYLYSSPQNSTLDYRIEVSRDGTRSAVTW